MAHRAVGSYYWVAMLHSVLHFLMIFVSTLGFYAVAARYDDADLLRTAKDTQANYSPFIVQVSGHGVLFEQIRFKDVGMSLAPEDQAFVYETIAEALSSRLAKDTEMNLDARVVYSEDVADPAFHRACSASEVYVDLWHDASSPKWGYSLWSGCSEEARFAWRQLRTSEADPATTVEPLARDIAADLANAVRTGCFTARC